MFSNKNKDPETPEFQEPVGWLLGPQLIAGLKWIALYAIHGGKLDARDWMVSAPIPVHKGEDEHGEFWFDYLADTGDGERAVFTLAYLCMNDLWCAEHSAPEQAVWLEQPAGGQRLPRGSFLFVGGDTAYHIADLATLAERFVRPFNGAFDAIVEAGGLPQRRPIYGIPGNHDYYDALDGFNRQFRAPIGGDEARYSEDEQTLLALKGYTRGQSASYLALELPFGWWFWGVDAEGGKVDRRQQAFFSTLPRDKLIVATPQPSTVFGAWADREVDAAEGHPSPAVDVFRRFDLPASFTSIANGALREQRCRLDISGDIHHYARYWGATGAGESNYASVVAGGGGAFLHASHTDVGSVAERALYPSKNDSHRVMVERLLDPWNIARGGYVWLTGAMLAFLTYFAVTIPESTWALLGLEGVRPCDPASCEGRGLLERVQLALDTSSFSGTNSWAYLPDLVYALALLGFLGYRLMRTRGYFHAANIYGDKQSWLDLVWDYLRPVVLAFIPLLLLVYWRRDELPGPFLASVLIIVHLAVAPVTLLFARRYADALFERVKHAARTKRERAVLPLLAVLALSSAAYGFLRFGTFPASAMTFNMLFIVVLLLVFAGLVLVAASAGGKLHLLAGKLRFAALGFWHALAQVCVPVALVLFADWITMLLVTAAVIGATYLGGKVFARMPIEDSLRAQYGVGRLLVIAWSVLAIGAFIAAVIGEAQTVGYARLLAAPVLGAVFSCVWFGWYLAVSLAFNGHNNEAGGGARAERYRHFIRFCLTENTLTGYVIGVDTPVESFGAKGARPKFRLVDKFLISARGS